jgi:hypothetical protein
MKQTIADEIMTNLSKDDPAKYKRVMDSMNMTPYDRLSGQDYLYDHLPAEIRNEAASDPRIVAMGEELPSRLPDLQSRIVAAMDSYKAAKTEHVNELATKIGAGMNGQLLKSAIQDYKMAMYIAGQTVFYGEIKQELEKNDPKNAIDILRNRYWNIELKLENPHTGALNYDQRDADRAEILADARAIGLEESDITVRMPTGNAMVDSALNQYHTDMETLKPMWEVDDPVN